MMVVPVKWWLLGGGLLLTLWLVWQAPPATDNNIKVVTAVKPTVQHVNGEIETQPQSTRMLNRQSPEIITNLFGTPPTVIDATNNIPETKVSSAKKPLPPIPFRYIGRLEKDKLVTVFIMDGMALHLLEVGDSPRDDYQLEAIDLAAGELRWRYLPTQKIRNMSIQP